MLQKAMELIAAQKFPIAEALLNSIIQTSPQNAPALNLMGILRLRQGHPKEAERYFKNASGVAPDFAEPHARLGSLYHSLNRWDDAATEFATAISLAPRRGDSIVPEYVAVLRTLAAAALAERDAEKALSYLLKAKNVAPANSDVLFEFAMVALRLSLYDDAIPPLLSVLKNQPDEPRALYALGRARMSKGEFGAAEELFRRYVALRPAEASGHYGLGHVLALLKRNEEASQSFHRSLELQPNQTESPYQLGLIALADGDMKAARAWFEKVLTRYADHTGALLGMGQVDFQQKDYAAARSRLSRAVALDGSLMKAHYYLGLTLARLGEKDEGRKELDLAAQLEREQKEQGKVILRLANESESKRETGHE